MPCASWKLIFLPQKNVKPEPVKHWLSFQVLLQVFNASYTVIDWTYKYGSNEWGTTLLKVYEQVSNYSANRLVWKSLELNWTAFRITSELFETLGGIGQRRKIPLQQSSTRSTCSSQCANCSNATVKYSIRIAMLKIRKVSMKTNSKQRNSKSLCWPK